MLTSKLKKKWIQPEEKGTLNYKQLLIYQILHSI